MKQEKRIHLFITSLLIIATFIVYCRVLNHEFINFDDDVYVSSNTNIQKLNLNSLVWAFKATYASNWHPLTWISHMIDYKLFGLKAGGHHFTSLLLHLLNSLMLLYVLNLMAGSFWRSAFVAALFALHPLHVESVAWVAERKDVLSTFFCMLTLWAYIRYVKSPKIKTYIPVITLFSLGLMSKPMLVTLPFLLLLMDYWPLNRTMFRHDHSQTTPSIKARKLLIEKIPLFLLSAISSVITYAVQQKSGAVVPSERLTFGIRLENAIVSYLIYIFKMILPAKLAVFYPHPMSNLPLWQVFGAGLILIATSILAIIVSKKYPYALVGWFWYLGTLLPVIGFVQVGMQAMADRYTYIPLIGLFIILAWGVPDLTANISRRVIKEETKRQRLDFYYPPNFQILRLMAFIAIIALSIGTWCQVGYWENSITLLKHTIAVTKENSTAQYNLGVAFADQKKPALALVHFEEAIRIDPFNFRARYNLGKALDETGRYEEAEEQFRAAIMLNPTDADSHNNLACVLMELGRYDEAIAEYKEALELKPDDSIILNNLLSALAKTGDESEILKQYTEALKINPSDPFTYYNLGNLMVKRQKWNEAIHCYSEAVRLKPDYADAYYNLGVTFQTIGKLDEAFSAYEQAIKAKPDFTKPHNNMAVILFARGDYAGAWRELELYIKGGGCPHPGFIKALSEKMPKPPK